MDSPSPVPFCCSFCGCRLPASSAETAIRRYVSLPFSKTATALFAVLWIVRIDSNPIFLMCLLMFRGTPASVKSIPAFLAEATASTMPPITPVRMCSALDRSSTIPLGLAYNREIQRRSGLALGTVQQDLVILRSQDLVVSDGNRVLFSANGDHPLFAEKRTRFPSLATKIRSGKQRASVGDEGDYEN